MHVGHLVVVLFVLAVMAFGFHEAVALGFDPTASFLYQRVAGQVATTATSSESSRVSDAPVETAD